MGTVNLATGLFQGDPGPEDAAALVLTILIVVALVAVVAS